MIIEKIDALYCREGYEKERTAFYISEAGKCPRAIWFSYKKYPKKPKDARTQRIFEHGDHTHMRFMSVLFTLGLVTAVEVKIPDHEIIHGRADAIISVDGEPYVVELKSVGSYKFKKGEADADHIKQLQLYLHFFKINKGILLYENKDTQDLMEFAFEYNPNLVKEILAGFEKLQKQVDANEMPEVPADLDDWRCKFCDYAESCPKMKKQ